MDIAHRIQQSLLPPPRPDWNGTNVVCFSNPAREVGGDLYAYHLHYNGGPADRPDKYIVAVGDVSGKGMPAALLMAISLSSFRLLVEQDLDPGLFLAKMDTTLTDYTRTRKQNCALVYAELSHASGGSDEFVLRTANAGCISPLIKRRSGAVEWVEVGGLPLGVGLGATIGYQEGTMTLAKGDLLILTSDGLVEAVNAHDEMLGFERFETMVAELPSAPADEVLLHLRARVDEFVQGTKPHDDMTIVMVQV
jgi:serine phosphatase RsbU (regulator of sigma subunit)